MIAKKLGVRLTLPNYLLLYMYVMTRRWCLRQETIGDWGCSILWIVTGIMRMRAFVIATTTSCIYGGWAVAGAQVVVDCYYYREGPSLRFPAARGENSLTHYPRRKRAIQQATRHFSLDLGVSVSFFSWVLRICRKLVTWPMLFQYDTVSIVVPRLIFHVTLCIATCVDATQPTYSAYFSRFFFLDCQLSTKEKFPPPVMWHAYYVT